MRRKKKSSNWIMGKQASWSLINPPPKFRCNFFHTDSVKATKAPPLSIPEDREGVTVPWVQVIQKTFQESRVPSTSKPPVL